MVIYFMVLVFILDLILVLLSLRPRGPRGPLGLSGRGLYQIFYNKGIKIVPLNLYEIVTY